MGYWPLKDPLGARSRSIFTAFGLYHCGEVNDLSLHRKGPGTALIDRHLYLKVKIIKTKHSSQTYVIDPKMCWNSFHSMATFFECARQKAWPCISAGQYHTALVFCFTNEKKLLNRSFAKFPTKVDSFIPLHWYTLVSYKIVVWLHSSLFTVA